MCDIRITSSGIRIDVTITKELQEELEQWLPIRMQTIVELCVLAEKLGSLSKRTNIAKIMGASTSLFGGIGTVASVLFAPFTGGLSLAGGAILLSVGVTGAATTAGTAIVKHVIESGVVRKVQDAIDKDRVMTEKMNSCLLKFKEALDRGIELSNFIENKAQMAATVCGTVAEGAKLVQAVLPSAKNSTYTVIRLSTKASKFFGKIAIGAKIAGTALTIVSIPIDLYQLFQTAHDIASGSPNEIAKKVMDMVHELRQEYATLKELLEDIKKK